MAWPARSAHKYAAKPTEYNGVRYASKAEAARAAELDLAVKVRDAEIWLPQPKFRLGCPENVYVADFFVMRIDVNEGPLWHVEDVKGFSTDSFKRNVRLLSSSK